MSVITVPKEMAQYIDLVILPKREYDELRARTPVCDFVPTVTQKRALARAENNFRRGRTLTYDQFAEALGGTR
jgi:hypothetical protein